ncbi:MAG: transporter substrate-binding domain-containing protein, partial [Alteromonadales bacterium]|nr:transporter substrate-binding domain-containing protein [Alteromonadales bacterium]
MNFFYKQGSYYTLITLFLSFFSLAMSAEASVNTQKEVDKTITWIGKQPLTIAINETSFPYHSVDKEGNATGIMADMWRLWANKQQVEIQFVVMPWLDTLSQVAQGNIDIHGGLSIIDSRKKTLSFAKSLFSIYPHLYINQQLNDVNNIADLKPYSIGVVRGSAHVENMRKYHSELALKVYENRHDLYRAALNDEILVFTGLEKLADNFDDYDRLRQRFPVHKVIRYQEGDYGVAVGKNKDQLLAFIEQGFDKISRDERVSIERKWLGIDKQKDSLLVAFSFHYPPYMGVSPAGEPQGLLIDEWRLWSKKVGINIEFVARDMVEGLDLTETQKTDVLLAYPSHAKIPKTTLFADPIYLSDIHIYLSSKITDAEGKKLKTLEQFNQHFKKHVIGVWQNSTYKEELLAQYPEL